MSSIQNEILDILFLHYKYKVENAVKDDIETLIEELLKLLQNDLNIIEKTLNEVIIDKIENASDFKKVKKNSLSIEPENKIISISCMIFSLFHSVASSRIVKQPETNSSFQKLFSVIPTQNKQYFCQKLIEHKLFGYIGMILSIFPEFDFKNNFIAAFEYYSPEERVQIEEDFYSILQQEILERFQYGFIPSIKIKEIEIPPNTGFPTGTLSDLRNYNIIIGKNNQKKTRLISLINAILISILNYPKKYNTVFKNPNHRLSKDIIECLNKGVNISLEIINFKKSEKKKKHWGWDFPSYEKHIHEIKLKTENNQIIIVSSNNITDIFRNTIIYMKFLFISEYFNVNEKERFPETGFGNFMNEFLQENQPFLENFRRIIYFFHKIQDHIPDILNYNPFSERLQNFWINNKMLLKKTLIDILFDFPSELPKKFINSLKENSIFRAQAILRKNKIQYRISHESNRNEFLLEVQPELEGNEIAKQGHGIRKITTILTASLFNNILFIDEPENGLHVDLQQDLALFLALNSTMQTFITTHSPAMIVLNPEVRVFTIDHGRIQSRTISLSDFDHLPKIEKNLRHIRNLTGATLESLLFAKGIIFLEGKNDKKGFSKLLRNYNLHPIPKNGRDKLNIAMKSFKELRNLIPTPIFYIFDKDYFNNRIFDIDEVHSFTLPCYSFENLLLDPIFLENIFSISRSDILHHLTVIIKPKREQTLRRLLMHHILGMKIPKVIREQINKLNIDWSKNCLDEIKKIFLKNIQKITEQNLQQIINLHQQSPNLKDSTLNYIILIQLFGINIPTEIEEELEKATIDWNNLDRVKIYEILLGTVSDEKIQEAIKDVQAIDNSWESEGFRYVEVKSWFSTLLQDLLKRLNIPEETKVTKIFLEKEYSNYILKEDIENPSLSQELQEIVKKILEKCS